MFVYVAIFVILSFLTLLHYGANFDRKARRLFKTIIFVLLILFIGLRRGMEDD